MPITPQSFGIYSSAWNSPYRPRSRLLATDSRWATRTSLPPAHQHSQSPMREPDSRDGRSLRKARSGTHPEGTAHWFRTKGMQHASSLPFWWNVLYSDSSLHSFQESPGKQSPESSRSRPFLGVPLPPVCRCVYPLPGTAFRTLKPFSIRGVTPLPCSQRRTPAQEPSGFSPLLGARSGTGCPARPCVDCRSRSLSSARPLPGAQGQGGVGRAFPACKSACHSCHPRFAPGS